MLLYFDTHSHKTYPFPTGQLTQLIVSTRPSGEELALIDNSFTHHLLFAKGLHPWFVETGSVLNMNSFTATNISAIGEIGLDFSKQYLATQALQLHCFELQLKVAQELDLPVSIHCRAAFPELLECLKRYSSVKGVLHGFMGSVEQAKPFIKLGYKLGVNGIVCNPNAPTYHRLVSEVPLKYLVLESDYPYVLNQHKQPVLVDQVADSIALLLKIPLDEVTSITYDTASKLFIRNSNEAYI